MNGTLIYDADCGFCTKSAKWLASDARIDVASWQKTDLPALGLTEADVTTAAYWVVNGVARDRGALAIASALRARGGVWKIAGSIIPLPVVRPVANIVYKQIAKNRHKMPGGTDACKVDTGSHPVAPKPKRLI